MFTSLSTAWYSPTKLHRSLVPIFLHQQFAASFSLLQSVAVRAP